MTDYTGSGGYYEDNTPKASSCELIKKNVKRTR